MTDTFGTGAQLAAAAMASEGVADNHAAFERARSVLPGGVNSPVRAYGSVGGDPRFLVSANGPWVTDIEGRDYADLVCSWGPALLGHAHPEVVAAVQGAAARGLSFGAPTVAEAELAEEIRRRVPAAERVRLVSTGTEATMTAVRLARGYTGRTLIIKFAGCYHGHVDSLLAEAGSGVATLSLPGSAGVTAASAAETLVLPYNDLDAVEQAFAARGPEIAAVITEASPANMGVVPPAPGFNAGLRRITAENGALMIMDEVLTGFRVGPSGWWGYENALAASEEDTYTPDILTFGKVVGGGMPLAALGGSAEIMDHLAPTGPVYQAGTLSGNPVAVAAGLATLRLADDAVYSRVNEVSSILAKALGEALAAEGVPHVIQRAGSLFSAFYGPAVVDGVANYATAQAQETFRYRALFHAMLESGVNLPPSVFEAWFVSAAHDDAAIDRILAALPGAARAAAHAKA